MRPLMISNSVTNRDSKSVEKYFLEISKIPLLSYSEEEMLAIRIRQGDRRALELMVRANLRFVVSVAKKYQHLGLPLADLINEGNIGLITAANRFDHTRGFRFISYAVWWVRQFILMAIGEKSAIVRLPMSTISLQRKIREASGIFEQEFEREPSAEEIADAMKIELENIVMARSEHHISLDEQVSQDNETSLLESIEDQNCCRPDELMDHNESLKTEVDRSLAILTEKQKEVICWYFGVGMDHALTLDEIGNRLHTTRERARQIKEKAIEKIRADHPERLRIFLGN